MKADKALLQYKYDSVIKALSELKGVSLRQALDMFYKSQTYLEMREGVSDMHCRSDIYLAEDIISEGSVSTMPNKSYTQQTTFL